MKKLLSGLTTCFIYSLVVVSSLCHADYAAVSKNGNAALASVHPLATSAGLDAIKRGGNAVDAAVAVAYTLGVVNGYNSGIGGGCFIVIRWADGTIEAIDGREMAPAQAHKDMFIKDGKVDRESSKTGALSIGVPGSVAALDYLQRKGGKLKLADVVLPAAVLADQGFEVDAAFARRLSARTDAIKMFPESTAIFIKKDSQPYAAGDRLVQKDLAETYRGIAKEGAAYFYKGAFAKAVDKWMQANGGLVRHADFVNYHIKLREPVISSFQGYTLYGFPPPSSGGVHVAQILNILEQFPLLSMNEQDRSHVIAEAMKLAYADRAYWLGDPDYVKVPKGLTDKKYAQSLAKKINLQKVARVEKHNTPPGSEKDFFEQLQKHTTHIATADKDGNWVAITTTLNTSFGSKVVIPGTGVMMNNQMDDFSAKEGTPNAFNLVGAYANSVQAGKRPLSSMSPTIVMKADKPVMTLGAAGGPTIINQVVQTIINHLALGMPLDDAMAKYRIHHQWNPDRLIVEDAIESKVKADLEHKGHDVQVWGTFGATQAIALRNGKFVAVSEPRLSKNN